MRALTETEIDLIAGASHGNGSSVTVTGPPRYPSTWMPWTGSGGSGGDYGGNGGSDPPPPPPDPYADRVVIDPSVPPALHDRAAAAQQKMIAELHELAEKYSHVPPGTHINLNGHDVTAEQLRNAVEKLSFTITWGQDYGPYSNGANDAGNVHINLDKLEGYINQDHDWADWGTNWLINHEVGHLLRGDQAWLDAYNRYLATDPTPTQEEFKNSQSFWDEENEANRMGYDLGQLFNEPSSPYPPIELGPLP